MGGTTFVTAIAKDHPELTAKPMNELARQREALGILQRQARYDHGHGGYTGTIAEKNGLHFYRRVDSLDAALELADSEELLTRNQKWGPAELIDCPTHYVFAGWASC